MAHAPREDSIRAPGQFTSARDCAQPPTRHSAASRLSSHSKMSPAACAWHGACPSAAASVRPASPRPFAAGASSIQCILALRVVGHLRALTAVETAAPHAQHRHPSIAVRAGEPWSRAAVVAGSAPDRHPLRARIAVQRVGQRDEPLADAIADRAAVLTCACVAPGPGAAAAGLQASIAVHLAHVQPQAGFHLAPVCAGRPAPHRQPPLPIVRRSYRLRIHQAGLHRNPVD